MNPIRFFVCVGVLCGPALLRAAPSPPPEEGSLEASIRRGVNYLLQDQNKDGSWGSATRTKDLNIYAPVPGAHDAFRSAVTAMAVEALIESQDPRPEANAALERGQAWLVENLPHLRRANATAIYNVWGHAYGIQALVAIYHRAPEGSSLRPKVLELIKGQIELLGRYESVDGGWGYYDFLVGAKHPASSSTSFVTATVLIAFHRAQAIGVEIPDTLRERAIASLNRQRKPDNTYVYSESLKMQPMRGINRAAGSLGRSQACNLALRFWGDKTITDAVLDEWLNRLVARNGWLSIGRKRPVPHEAWFQVAGYFFYYGHYYAALCIEQLEEADAYRDRLAELLLGLQESDGSWWDFPLYDYHQPYGTAFAVMSLVRCRHPDTPRASAPSSGALPKRSAKSG